jgi:hypothetical protein
MSKTLHETTKGIQIGINYHPKTNHHNPDQDWVQTVLLNVKPNWDSKLYSSYACIVVFVYIILAVVFKGASF